jgi:glycosyltransferase involved in cell wall biosynthesis
MSAIEPSGLASSTAPSGIDGPFAHYRVADTFAPLPDIATLPAEKLPKVCLVTGEFLGLFRNGGLGTSMTGLVELLAAYGADVTVIYTAEAGGPDTAGIKARYAQAGIKLEILNELTTPPVLGPMESLGWTAAYRVYAVLKTREYDVIHFNDTMGEGLYCLTAKRCGLAFEKSLLCVALHSPTQWILAVNRHPSNWLGFSCFTTGERLSIEAADLLWGPSRYLLDWIQAEGYRLPAQVYHQQYVIPTGAIWTSGRSKCANAALPPVRLSARPKPKEIVFFGRLEERKGIRLFCSALSRVGPELARRGIRVTFMGKPSSVCGIPADEFLKSRSRGWSFDWRIESSLGQSEAVAYLTSGECVAVIASPFDNSPCTLYEALQFGIPFIAARRGGIPELIHPDDQAVHLFDYKVASLAERMLATINEGIGLARPAISVAENQARWLGMHVDWRRYLLPIHSGEVAAVRRYGVVIDHAGDAEELARTLTSLAHTLSSRIVAYAIVQRELAPVGDVPKGSLVASEFVDVTAQDILRHFDDAGADTVFAIKSGLWLDRRAGKLLDCAFASAFVDGIVPSVAVDSPFGIRPALGGGAAYTFFAGEAEGLAIAVSCAALGDSASSTLSISHGLMGLLDEALARGLRIWPMPEPIVRADKIVDAHIETGEIETRVRRFARTSPEELYRMLALGYYTYKTVFPTETVFPTRTSATGLAVAIQVPVPYRLRAMARAIVFRLFGARGVARVAGLVRRIIGV